MSEQNIGMLLPDQPPETPEESRGSRPFETAVAMRGGVLKLEVSRVGGEVMLTLEATGGARKVAPMLLDRFQARAMMAAMAGAYDAIQDMEDSL